MPLGKVQPPDWADAPIPSVFSKEYQEFLSFQPQDIAVIESAWNDPIVRQRGLKIVQEMLQDARVSQGSDVKKAAVINVGFKTAIDTEIIKDPELAKELRAYVEFLFNEVKGSRYEFFKNILSAFDYGHSFNIITAKAMKRGRFKGKWVCDYITPVPPGSYKIAFDDSGTMSHIESNISGMAPKNQRENIKRIGLDRIIYMRIGGNFNSPYGKSQITKVYEPWWNKKIMRRMRNTAMDRFGTPYMVGKVSPNTPDKKRKELLSTIVKMSVESVGVINNDESIEAVQTGGLSGVDAFQQALAYEDKEIISGIVGSTLNIMEGGSQGSYAQARVHQDNFLYSVQEIIQILEEVINEQFVYRFVALSYGEDVADGVRVNWQTVSDPQNDTFIARFTQLAPLIFDQNDPREKAWVRKLLDWQDIPNPMKINEKGEMVDPDNGKVLIPAAQAAMLGFSPPTDPATGEPLPQDDSGQPDDTGTPPQDFGNDFGDEYGGNFENTPFYEEEPQAQPMNRARGFASPSFTPKRRKKGINPRYSFYK